MLSAQWCRRKQVRHHYAEDAADDAADDDDDDEAIECVGRRTMASPPFPGYVTNCGVVVAFVVVVTMRFDGEEQHQQQRLLS